MYLELAARLSAAAAAGALLGAEREFGGRHHAGYRTHALVSLGACLFTVLGVYGFQDVGTSAAVDPARIAAQVASGIGFIGAGAILRDGVTVRGLTTAATLWVAAAVGASAGAGLYAAVGITLILTITALVGLRSLRGLHPGRLLRRSMLIVVEYSPGHGTLGPLTRGLHDCGASVRSLIVDDQPPSDPTETGTRHVEIRVQPANRTLVENVLETIRQRPEVHVAYANSHS